MIDLGGMTLEQIYQDVIHVAIPSYSRAGMVRTLEPMPFAHLWVPESQGDKYRAYYGEDRVRTIPDSEDGNIVKKRNAIMDRAPCPWLVLIDDDIRRMGYWEAGGRVWASPEELQLMMAHYFQLAQDLGVRLWGVNQNKDPLIFRTYMPFNLVAPILGPFAAHLEPTLRYDESISPIGTKEDYDFWLQNIKRYRYTLRVNKWHYDAAHGTLRGGMGAIRTMQYEREAAERLIAKWGSRMIKVGGTAGGKGATGKNILNMRIQRPLPGC